MTALDIPHSLGEIALVTRQLDAVERFHAARKAAEQAAQSAASSRELRMDAARRLAVLRRQQEALVRRSHEQLQVSGQRPLASAAARRAVLAHRNAWFRGKVGAALNEQGVQVVAEPENGADAIGVSVAEQPDLVLVEDGLEMMPADEVILSLRQYCPAAVVAAQVASSNRIPALIDAGASSVFVRQVPPVDVAAVLWELLG